MSPHTANTHHQQRDLRQPTQIATSNTTQQCSNTHTQPAPHSPALLPAVRRRLGPTQRAAPVDKLHLSLQVCVALQHHPLAVVPGAVGLWVLSQAHLLVVGQAAKQSSSQAVEQQRRRGGRQALTSGVCTCCCLLGGPHCACKELLTTLTAAAGEGGGLTMHLSESQFRL